MGGGKSLRLVPYWKAAEKIVAIGAVGSVTELRTKDSGNPRENMSFLNHMVSYRAKLQLRYNKRKHQRERELNETKRLPWSENAC